MGTTENLVRNPMYKSCTILVLNDTFLRFLYNLGATSQKESEKAIVLFNKHNVSNGPSCF